MLKLSEFTFLGYRVVTNLSRSSPKLKYAFQTKPFTAIVRLHMYFYINVLGALGVQ